MLERLLGPLPVLTTPIGRRLADLARASISKRVFNHYLGFFKGIRREAEIQHRDNQLTAKTLLYGYRVALTGADLLATGEVVTDVRPLAEEHDLSMVSELIDIKSGAELQIVSNGVFVRVEGDFERLEAILQTAFESSPLPEPPPNESEFEAFAIQIRLELSNSRPPTKP